MSLTLAEEGLPGTVSSDFGEKRKRKGIFKRILNSVLGNKDEADYGYAPGIGKQY